MQTNKQLSVAGTLSYVTKFIEEAEVARARARAGRSASVVGGATRRLDKLMHYLDNMGLQRSVGQRGLHVAMAGTMITRIFDGESDADMEMAMAKHDISSSRQQLMCITPRRFGKTTAVAMFCAALAVSVPGVVVSIFSTARRASSLLLQQIKSFIHAIPGASSKIVSSNVETIVLRDGSFRSKVSSYPGQAKT
jgi:hypothetical protein